MEAYVFENIRGDEAFLAGKVSLLAEQYQKELEDYEMGNFEFAMDIYKSSMDELEKRIKERFLIINQKEYSVGSSPEEERKAIDEIHLQINKDRTRLDDVFNHMYSSFAQKRFLKSLKSLSDTFNEEIREVLEITDQVPLYSLKGLQNNDFYHAFDYVDQYLNGYVADLGEYKLLIICGVSD